MADLPDSSAAIQALERKVEMLRAMLREAIEAQATAQRALSAAQLKYEHFTDRVPWIVARVRPDGHYADVNQTLAALLGREVREVIDRPVGSLDEPREWVRAILDEHETEETSVTLQVDGAPREYVVLKFRYQRDGYTSIVGLDQTERAQALEEARRQAERADAASRAKSEFLAVMSHEVRTPLNGVLGMAALLDESSLQPEQKEWVRTILSSGRSLTSLINNVLDLAKIEAGGIELERRAYAPKTVVTDVADLFRAEAATKGVELRVDIAEDLPKAVMGDALRLRQILANLVSNAMKFTSEGHVALRASVEGTALSLAVEDTGIGIDPEKLDSLFEAFVQADASTTRKFGGTGLGLSIIKGFAEAMGGQIRVESELGRGSTFTLQLPYEAAHARTLSKPAAAAIAPDVLGGLRVLVAEDNRVNRLVAQRFLERMGCEVTCVNDGQEALDALGRAPFDVILMDMDMPVMDGVTATKRVRASREAYASIPIVALTANVMMDQRELCLQAGMTGFLSKPVTKARLHEALAPHRVSSRHRDSAA